MKKLGIVMRYEDTKYYINRSYIKYFEAYFSIIPIVKKDDSILKLCDCFLIPGGYDIDPSFYNEENEGSKNISIEIDELDFFVLRHAEIKKKPLLGICRGFQIIAVYYGAKLAQNIDNHIGKNHIVSFNSYQYDLSFTLKINSFHHQGVFKLPSKLAPTSISKDNVIESFEHKKLLIVGLQFHPELMKNDTILNYILTILA